MKLNKRNTNPIPISMAHFLILVFPLHSSVHPTLELARRLLRAGAFVTYATTISAYRLMVKSPAPEGLSYASFSDGYDDGFHYNFDNDSTGSTPKITEDDSMRNFMAQFRQAGAQKISDIVRTHADAGRPVTCIVYSMLQSWAADVSRELNIPSVAVWIQPATVLAIYYHYFHGYDYIVKCIDKDPSFVLELPGLPPLAPQDLPSFLLSSDTKLNMLPSFRDQFEKLDKEEKEVKPRVLVNTFDALERDALGSVDGLDLISVGPLITSDFSDRKDPCDYIQWLDSKLVSSVVYISFGSIVFPSKRQMEEILNGLLESGRPFLWVIRVPEKESDMEFDAEIRSQVGAIEEGLVVPWCSQVEVLSHPSTGCFVTHCGWNSTLESVGLGVPMVCFPQWTDQTTNGKLAEDVWEMGVRVKVGEDGILGGGELKRCLEEVMGGERGKEIKKNAVKWRDLAGEAVEEGGSSDRNIRAFVEEMRGGSLG